MDRRPRASSFPTLTAALVRIWTGAVGQEVAGAGLLVDSRHVVTCAHVAAVALTGSRHTGPEPPQGRLRLDFPGLAQDGGEAPARRATVMQASWRSVGMPARTGDIAVLELDSAAPPGAVTPPLLAPPEAAGRLVAAYGFPQAYSGNPVVSVNTVSGAAGPQLGWLQLDFVHGFELEGVRARWDEQVSLRLGFSGSPVWDLAAGAVVGIAAVADADLERGTGFMIPLPALATASPEVAAARGWRLRFDPQRDEHWVPSARGVDGEDDLSPAEAGHAARDLFTGRTAALQGLAALAAGDTGARMVVGRAGSGKSAVLARLVTLADRERDETALPDTADGTVPAAGSVDVALIAKGLLLRDVVDRLALWLDAEATSAKELVDELAARAPEHPPLLVVDQLEDAREPEEIAGHLLARLVEHGAARVVVGLRAADGCPIAERLRARFEEIDLDGRYFESGDMEEYVAQLLRRRERYRGNPDLTDEVTRRIAAAAGKSFLVAKLSALWQAERDGPLEPVDAAYPIDVDEAMRLYVEAVADRLRGREDAPFDEFQAKDLLAALAYARSLGLPASGPVWAALAGAVRDHEYDHALPGRLLDTVARYLLRTAVLDDRPHHRLFHPALAGALRGGDDEGVRVEARIVRRLGALCPTDSVEPADPYIARHLASHVAAAGAWSALARQLDVLDRLDPASLRAEVLPAVLREEAVEAPIVGVLRAEHLMQRSDLRSRTGLRQLGMARAGKARSFDDDAPRELPAWTLRSAVVALHAPHIALDAGAQVHALTAVPASDGAPHRLAAGCKDGYVRLWSTVTGSPSGDPVAVGGRGPRHAVWALDACQTAAGVWLAGGTRAGSVRVWDPTRTELPPPFPSGHERGVRAVATLVHDDALYVVTGGEEPEARVWDPAGRLVARLSDHGAVRALAVARVDGGQCVLGGGDDGSVRVWRLPERLDGESPDEAISPQRTLTGPRDWIRGICVFGDDGDRRVSGVGDDPRLAIWPLAQRGKAVESSDRHEGCVHAVAPYRDGAGGTLLATAGDDATVRLWKPEDARAVARLTGHTGAVLAVTAYDGEVAPYVVTGGEDCTLRIWLPTSSDPAVAASEAAHGGPVLALAPLAEGRFLTGGADGTVHEWDRSTGHARGEVLEAGVGAVRALAVGTDGAVTVAGDAGIARYADLARGRDGMAWRQQRPGVVRALLDGLAVDDVAAVATGDDEGAVRLWRAADGVELRSLRSTHGGPIRGLAPITLRGGDRCLVVVGPDRSFALRPLGGGKQLGDPFRGHLDWPMAVCAYEDEGWQLVTAADDGTVRSWDPDSRRPLSTVGWHDAPIRALAVLEGEDRSLVVSGDEAGSVRVWNPRVERRLLRELTLGVRVDALAAAGGSLLVGTEEGHLVIDLEEGRRRVA